MGWMRFGVEGNDTSLARLKTHCSIYHNDGCSTGDLNVMPNIFGENQTITFIALHPIVG